MEPGGKIEIVVALRQGHGLPGGLQVTAGAHHQVHPLVRQLGQQGIPVGVKGVVIVMGVGIEDHKGLLWSCFFHHNVC